jgi:hypothetical protein
MYKILIRDYMRSQTRIFNKMIEDGDRELQKLEIQEERLKAEIRKEQE